MQWAQILRKYPAKNILFFSKHQPRFYPQKRPPRSVFYKFVHIIFVFTFLGYFSISVLSRSKKWTAVKLIGLSTTFFPHFHSLLTSFDRIQNCIFSRHSGKKGDFCLHFAAIAIKNCPFAPFFLWFVEKLQYIFDKRQKMCYNIINSIVNQLKIIGERRF